MMHYQGFEESLLKTTICGCCRKNGVPAIEEQAAAGNHRIFGERKRRLERGLGLLRFYVNMHIIIFLIGTAGDCKGVEKDLIGRNDGCVELLAGTRILCSICRPGGSLTFVSEY